MSGDLATPTAPAAPAWAASLAATFFRLGEYLNACLRFLVGGRAPGRLPAAAEMLTGERRWEPVGQSLDAGFPTEARRAEFSALLRLSASSLLAWPPFRSAAETVAVGLARERLLAEPSAASLAELRLSAAGLVGLMCLGDSGRSADTTAALLDALGAAPLQAGDQLIVATMVERLFAAGELDWTEAAVAAAQRALLLQGADGELGASCVRAGIVPAWRAGEVAVLLQTCHCGMLDELLARLADPASPRGPFPSAPLVDFLKGVATASSERPELAAAADRVAARVAATAHFYLKKGAAALGELERATGLRGLSKERKQP